MNSDKVWYFSYGSNVLPERFHCYIRGGQLNQQGKSHRGCRQKKLPEKQRAWQIPHRLCFARYSSNWEGGVAFIHPPKIKNQSTWGVKYLISMQQFVEVVSQENDLKNPVTIDLDLLIRNKSMSLPNLEWYDQLLLLGYANNYPILTFTSSIPQANYTKPSEAYLTTIIGGINQFYSIDKRQLINYLISKNGIRNNYSVWELRRLIDMVVESSLCP
jgi:hypothetical protein